MKKRSWVYISGLLVFAVVLAAYFDFGFSKKPKVNAPQLSQTTEKFEKFHYASYADKQFYGELDKAQGLIDSSEKIYGGIVSHHFFDVNDIAGFFNTFKKQAPRTVVIIGPNHYNVGAADILVSKYLYETPWGNLDPDSENISKLISAKILFQDEKPFEKEHAISTLVGFIKYYLPEAKIVPIILKRGVDRKNLDKLSEKLNEILPENSVVLASVDFSHHLNKIASEFHDKASIAAIQNFDWERIYGSEIDSPASIYALEKYLNLKGAQNIYYKNTNAAEITRNNFIEDNTSYLFAYFTKGKIVKNDTVTLLSFGDMMLGRDVGEFIKKGGDPFEKIRGVEGNFLKGADIISANLEGPITNREDCSKKAYSFRFVPQVVNLIRENRFNMINLANNHASDCQETGFSDTKSNLMVGKINYFGEPEAEKSYYIKEISGKRLAFIGIDLTSHSNSLDNYYALASRLKSENDYLVINIHWGIEYDLKPSAMQIEIGHKLIDSGADLIIGHHPHVVQPVEIYKNKAIFYSLGNFIFDQVGEKMDWGLGVGTVFSNESIGYSLFPFNIKKYQPTLLSAKQAKIFCDNYLKGVSGQNGCEFELNHSQY
jgi:MEMO1 family protein